MAADPKNGEANAAALCWFSPFEEKVRYAMANKRTGSKAEPDGGARAGKRKPKKENLRNLEVKDSQKVQGGTGEIPITKESDKATVKPF